MTAEREAELTEQITELETTLQAEEAKAARHRLALFPLYAERSSLVEARIGTWLPAELVFAAEARCPCGSGLAYHPWVGPNGYWDCARVLIGDLPADPVLHSPRMPFSFWSILPESSAHAGSRTTRP